MVTVPACKQCNEEKAGDDTYLRDMLVLDLDNTGHPSARDLARGKVVRSFQRNSSDLLRGLLEKVRRVPAYTPGGLYFGNYPALPLDGMRMKRTFARITRGLYFHVFNRRLPDDCTFDIRRADRLYRRDWAESMRRLGTVGQGYIGYRIFECLYTVAKEDPSVTLWLQQYYNVLISVITNGDKQRSGIPPRESVALAS
jgi:hypothetical protein